MKQFFLYLIKGIAMGCAIFTIISIIFSFVYGSTFIMENWSYTKMAIGSIICGIAFYLPALVYKSETLAMGLKVLIHMGIGLATYLCVAFLVGWIPVENGIWITIAVVAFVIVASFIIWSGFYFYYKSQAKKMNQKIREKQSL